MVDSQIIKNIIAALINKGISNPSQLATSVNYDQGNMSKIVNDKLRIPASLREKLYQKFGILHTYTITGEGSMFEEKSNNSTTSSLNQTGTNPSAAREMELLKKELEFKTREVELLNMVLAEKLKNETKTKTEDSELVEVLKQGLQAIQSTIVALFKSEEEYNKAMEFIKKPLSKVSVCVTDPDGKIVSVNEEFTKQTGYSLNEVIGKKPGSVLQGANTSQDSIKKIREAMLSRKYYEGEVLNYDKEGGEIKCRLTITPIKDKSGKLEKYISLAVFSKVNVLKYN